MLVAPRDPDFEAVGAVIRVRVFARRRGRVLHLEDVDDLAVGELNAAVAILI